MACTNKSTIPIRTTARTIDEYLQSAYDTTVCWKERWHYALIIGSIGVSSASDAADLFTIGYILGEEDFQNQVLHGDLSKGGAVAAGTVNLGMIVGGLVSAAAEEHVGRRATILLGLAVSFLGTIASATSYSVLSFSSCRFVVGMGVGAILSCSSAIVTELSPPRERGLIVSTANSFWTAGIIGNAIWAYLLFGVFHHSWRIYVLVTLLPTVVGFVLIFCLVPESPRFLAVQGNYESATLSANQIATAMGYQGAPLKVTEVSYHYTQNLSAGEVKPPSRSFRIKDKMYQAINNVKNLYQGDSLKPVITVQFLWISVSMGSALASWINAIFQKIHLRHIYLNFIFLNSSCVLGNIGSALLIDRIGRNKFFTSAIALASIALFVVAMIVSGTSHRNTLHYLEHQTAAIVLCTSFYYAGLTGVWTVLYVIVSEIFPTDVRATGIVICSTLGRLASVAATFVNGSLVDSPTVLLTVGAVILLSGALLSWVSPPEDMRCKPVRDRLSPVSDSRERDWTPMDYDTVPLFHKKDVVLESGNDYLSIS